MATADDPNAHVRAYLDYYVEAKGPLNYAVMLNGPWGVGKSYLIKRYFEERGGEKPTHVYVSVFGVSSAADLKRTLFAAFYPLLAGRGAEALSSMAKSAIGFFNVSTDIKPEDYLKIPKDKVIIIDDLERCSMPIQEVLGHLNPLVEHDDHKLIILGNNEEVPKDQQEAYQRQREKIIGQTLSVKSDIGGAYEYFLSKLQTELAKNFLKSSKDDVLAVYEQSGFNNLRVLQHTLQNFERLLGVLPERFHSKHSAMRELLKFIFAFALEYHTGNLTVDDLKNREVGMLHVARQMNAMRSGKDSMPKDNMDVSATKYVGLDLRDELLSNSTLVQILADGYINRDALVADLR